MARMKPAAQTRSNAQGRFTPKKAAPAEEENYGREDFFRDLKKDKSDPQWDRFKDFVKNIAAVPKEEVDELRAEHEREKKEKRAE